MMILILLQVGHQPHGLVLLQVLEALPLQLLNDTSLITK
jgi:hypothetical protein